MALANYGFNGSYLNIDNLMIDKRNKNIAFNTILYSSSQKTQILGEYRYNLSPYVAKDINDISNIPPSSPAEDTYWEVGTEPTGDWANFASNILHYRYSIWTPVLYKELFYSQSTKQVKEWNVNSWQTVPLSLISFQLWDEFFENKLSYNNGTDPYRQVYLYLKNSPMFSDCTDC